MYNKPEVRFETLVNFGRWLVPNYRFKWPQMAWWGREGFNHSLELFGEIEGMNTDRRFMISQLIRLTEGVEGDTVECGVYKGAGSYIICKENRSSKFKRVHHIFDSFEGLSQITALDGNHWSKNDLSVDLEAVKNNLKEFHSVKYYKGWIPTRFSEVGDIRFSFVHIDVDLFEPTRDSFEFFYPRMNDGGIILCDDYGFTTCPGATKAIDDYLIDKKEKMISLSGGGGFIIKGNETAVEVF